MEKHVLILVAISLFLCLPAAKAELSRASIDVRHNILLTDRMGRSNTIPGGVLPRLLTISPDKCAVAWISTGSDKEFLNIFRLGVTIRFTCEQLIRSYWFIENGQHVAMDCGGEHFAGTETLYDIATARKIDTVDQSEVPLEKRPKWSKESE